MSSSVYQFGSFRKKKNDLCLASVRSRIDDHIRSRWNGNNDMSTKSL
jgi:hypothetical protein